MQRVKTRLFSGAVCEQIVFNVPDRVRDIKKAEPIYGIMNGRRIIKKWVASINTCDRPMCDTCANHTEPDTDYCDFHNTEIARMRSEKAEELYQEQLRMLYKDG